MTYLSSKSSASKIYIPKTLLGNPDPWEEDDVLVDVTGYPDVVVDETMVVLDDAVDEDELVVDTAEDVDVFGVDVDEGCGEVDPSG